MGVPTTQAGLASSTQSRQLLGSLVKELGNMIFQLTSLITNFLSQMGSQASASEVSGTPTNEATFQQTESSTEDSFAPVSATDGSGGASSTSEVTSNSTQVKSVGSVDGDNSVSETESEGYVHTPVEPKDFGRELKKTGRVKWKVPNDHSSNYQLILRPAHRRKVASVEILSADGSEQIAVGVKAGIKKNGSPKIRFDVLGAEIPSDIKIHIKFNNGKSRYLDIENSTSNVTY